MTVAETMRLVERDDTSVVLFDFDSPTGANNPLGLVTILTDQDLGAVEAPFDVVKAKGSGQATRVLSDPQVRSVSLEVHCVAPDGKMSTLIAAVDRLYNLLTSDAAPDRLIAFDDGSGSIRYLEPLGIENAMPNLRGRDNTVLQATAEGIEAGLVFEISCLPYLVSPQITSDDNYVTNATMGQRDDNATGDPAFWAWSSTTNIAARSIDAAVGGYTFTIATTAARNLQQTTPVGTATAGNTYTTSFYLKAAAAGAVRAQAVIRFTDAAGAVLGTETVGVLTDIGTTWTRLGVSAVAPASTSRILVTLRFQNAAATTVQVWTRDAQAEPGNAMTMFRAGNDTVSADASAEFGLTFPLVVQGTAPTPVVFDIQPLSANSKVVSMRMASRWNHGVDGEQRILDYLNETHWIPGGATDARTAWTVTTENLGSEGGTNTDADAYNANGLTISIADASLGVRLRRWRAVRTTNLDSLRGEWMVYGRFDPRESDTEWLLQLQWGMANIDPVPHVVTPPKVISVESVGDTLDTNLTPYEYIPLGVMRVPQEGSLGAIRIELWVGRRNDITVGTAHLRFGGLFLMPFAPRSNMYVPGSERVVWNDEEFATPASRITSDPSGYWNAGTRLAGGGIRLDQPGESMGVRPNSGQAYGTGRAWIRFDVARADDPNPNSDHQVPTGYRVRVIRVSDNTVMARRKVNKAKPYVLQFDATAGELYQPQAIHVGNGGDRFTISEISKRFIPYVGQNERLVSDPEFFTRTKRDSVGNIQSHLEVQGQTPFVLEPGRYVISILPGEVRQPNHDNDNAPLNRTFNVRTRYSPRWTQ